MRMWGINPKKLCRQHLLGEHVEMHMFAGSLKKKRSIKGHIDKGQVEVHNLKKRHNELVKEMQKRNYKHKSLFPKIKLFKAGKVNKKQNYKILIKRCKECRKLIKDNFIKIKTLL